MPAKPASEDPDDTTVVSPVVVVTQTFPARPGAIPDAELFVREAVGPAGFEPAERRALYHSITAALLAAAGPPNGFFDVTVRILPDTVEVEVLHGAPVRQGEIADRLAGRSPEPFAAWFTGVLRQQGLSQQAAARRIGVSVRTISRWLRGDTEPRLRDLRRVQQIFGP